MLLSTPGSRLTTARAAIRLLLAHQLGLRSPVDALVSELLTHQTTSGRDRHQPIRTRSAQRRRRSRASVALPQWRVWLDGTGEFVVHFPACWQLIPASPAATLSVRCAYRPVSVGCSSLQFVAVPKAVSCRQIQSAAVCCHLRGWTFNPKVAGSIPARPTTYAQRHTARGVACNRILTPPPHAPEQPLPRR